MAIAEPKTDLLRYLRQGREGFLTELDGLSVYEARRPMTPTATNILGLVKHVAGVRHAGQADIMRELLDGAAGLTGPGNNMPERTVAEWEVYRLKVESAARGASN